MAVIAARELEDAVAAREPARQADRAQRGLRPRRDQAHLLDGRHRVGELLGELHLTLSGDAERRPLGGRLLHGLHDLRVRVPEDERAPGHDPVHVALPLRVDEVRALGAPREERLLAPDRFPGANGRVDAARDHLACAPEEGRRGGQSHSASSFAQ